MNPVLTYPEFTPGQAEPPYLAGRDLEQQTLCKPLKQLLTGKRPSQDIIVVGPRGNGKTALLRWFENKCEHNKTLDVVWLTPASIGNNLDELATRCAPPKKWKWLLNELEINIEIIKLKWQIGNSPSSLTELLIKRCQKKPLVLLLDEAHTLKQELGFTLLNVSQEVRAKAPLLLVLAGTPGIEQQLNDMETTFWTRSKRLGLDRLDEYSARDALTVPFSRHDIHINDAALDHVMIDSQGYAFFLQCWGAALTDILMKHEEYATRRLPITPAMTAEAQPEVDASRIDHYEPLREQIIESGLEPLAARIAEVFGGADTLEEHRLHDLIRDHLLSRGRPAEDVDIFSTRNTLATTGYIWRPPGQAFIWHTGIPSLMTYLLDANQLSATPARP